jgi:hypothetical protein
MREVVKVQKFEISLETNDLLQLWTFSNCHYVPIIVIYVNRVYFMEETRHLSRTVGVLLISVFKLHGCPGLHALSFWAAQW